VAPGELSPGLLAELGFAATGTTVRFGMEAVPA
jgi:hypothetical protein